MTRRTPSPWIAGGVVSAKIDIRNAMNRFSCYFPIGFISAVLVTSQLLALAPRTHAATDANGEALPGSGDGKSIKIDNSKGKETPLTPSGCVTPKDTEFGIGLPGWIAGLSGDFGVRGVVTNQDVKFTDILKRLDMVAAGSLYARYHRWEIFADGQYLKISDTTQLPGLLFDRARVSLKSAFAEAFLGYRLINCEKASLSIFAGARYNYMSGDLHIAKDSDPRFPILRELLGIPTSLRVSGSIDWVDPVIGMKGKVHVWKPVSLWAEGDVGGFDANGDSAFALTREGLRPVLKQVSSSDWSYQVQGGVEIQTTRWMWSRLGWRYLKYDYTSGGFTNKTELNGPYIETGVNF
jgi:opacity protein-like surface antigen